MYVIDSDDKIMLCKNIFEILFEISFSCNDMWGKKSKIQEWQSR